MSVGPVIGRVTDTVAVVLLEVNQNATVTCIASVLTAVTPHGRPVAQCELELKAGRPRAFMLSGLVPGQKHVVSFGGVHRDDAENRLGTFVTLGGQEPSVRIVAVAGDAPYALKHDAANVWEQLHADVDAGKVDVMLHLGCQVCVFVLCVFVLCVLK